MTPPELIQTFVNLREKWPHSWPGLTVVLDGALRRLGQDPEQATHPRAEALRICAFEVAHQIEVQALGVDAQQCEPAYHNRLHFADVLVGLTFLLKQARDVMQAPSLKPVAAGQLSADALSLAEWQAVLAVVAHDWQHPGTINQFPAQIESFTVAQLRPWMHRLGVAVEDQEVVARLILQTDPRRVKSSHEAMASRPFDLSDELCMGVLIQEADILASATPEMGPALTQQLAQEWQAHSPQMADQLLTTQGRMNFLKFGALFSSPPSQALGFDKMTAQQIQALTAGSF
jgi:hypothetical protein